MLGVTAQGLADRRRGRVRAGRRERRAPGRDAEERQIGAHARGEGVQRWPGARAGPQGIEGETHIATLATSGMRGGLSSGIPRLGSQTEMFPPHTVPPSPHAPSRASQTEENQPPAPASLLPFLFSPHSRPRTPPFPTTAEGEKRRSRLSRKSGDSRGCRGERLRRPTAVRPCRAGPHSPRSQPQGRATKPTVTSAVHRPAR